jgi:hypothetical protein
MTTTFKFPNFLELLSFAVVVDNNQCKINRYDLTLSGCFTEADVELAVYAFEATVINLPGSRLIV